MIFPATDAGSEKGPEHRPFLFHDKFPENCCPDGNCLTDNPCMLYSKMKFPYEEFNPPKLDDLSSD